MFSKVGGSVELVGESGEWFVTGVLGLGFRWFVTGVAEVRVAELYKEGSMHFSLICNGT